MRNYVGTVIYLSKLNIKHINILQNISKCFNIMKITRTAQKARAGRKLSMLGVAERILWCGNSIKTEKILYSV